MYSYPMDGLRPPKSMPPGRPNNEQAYNNYVSEVPQFSENYPTYSAGAPPPQKITKQAGPPARATQFSRNIESNLQNIGPPSSYEDHQPASQYPPRTQGYSAQMPPPRESYVPNEMSPPPSLPNQIHPRPPLPTQSSISIQPNGQPPMTYSSYAQTPMAPPQSGYEQPYDQLGYSQRNKDKHNSIEYVNGQYHNSQPGYEQQYQQQSYYQRPHDQPDYGPPHVGRPVYQPRYTTGRGPYQTQDSSFNPGPLSEDSRYYFEQRLADLQAQLQSFSAMHGSLAPAPGTNNHPQEHESKRSQKAMSAARDSPISPPHTFSPNGLPPPPPPPIDIGLQGPQTEKDIAEKENAKVSSPYMPSRNEGIQPTEAAIGNKRFQMVISRYIPEKSIREEKKIKLPDPDYKSTTVTYRKCMDSVENMRCLYDEVEIESGTLKDILFRTMEHIDEDLLHETFVKETTPFSSFVYNWTRLEKEQILQKDDSDDMQSARLDLKEVMTAMSLSEPRKMKSYFKEREQYLSTKTTTFTHLWTVFGPGSKVCARPFLDEWQVFEVQYYRYRNPPDSPLIDLDAPNDQFSTFDLACAAFDWDGTQFKRYTYIFTVDRFEGRRLLSQLPCFPLVHYAEKDEDQAKFEKNLIERGKEFTKLCTSEDKYVLRRYAGPILVANMQRYPDTAPDWGCPPHPVPVTRREITDQDVIIDNSAFVTSRRNEFTNVSENPLLGSRDARVDPEDCPCQICRLGPTRDWPKQSFTTREEQGKDFAASKDRLLLCPPKVLGYIPGERLWAQFRIDSIHKISETAREANVNRFDSQLELDQHTKKMLLALVKHHQARRDALSMSESSITRRAELDPIEGKGKGLAVLLHGPPGVGKTLTAEAVALATEKPLLPVSVAEIGTEPAEAEQKLTDVFADASRWNAVLLIDEADVFLEERVGVQDIKRNTLVSVLLRVLEYYDGIVILTTNRISSLDVAVQSRMHLAIQYKDLDKKQQIKLFWQFLKKIEDDIRISDRPKIEDYLGIICKPAALNGRQIRNIVSSAQAMANSEGGSLAQKHIAEVYEATEQFISCLKDLTTQRRMLNELGRK